MALNEKVDAKSTTVAGLGRGPERSDAAQSNRRCVTSAQQRRMLPQRWRVERKNLCSTD